MKYKELFEKLKGLSQEQLGQEVILLPEEGKGAKIQNIEVLTHDLYISKEYPEDGLFTLSSECDKEDYTLAYPKGTPILIKKNQLKPLKQRKIKDAVTLSDSDLIEAVATWVDKLCKSGGAAWSLSVPVNFNEDPDTLISELVKRYKQCVIAKSMIKTNTHEEVY